MEPRFIFAIACFLLLAGLLVVRYRKYNVHRALNLPKNPPIYSDDAIRSAKAIGQFLSERAKVCGLYFLSVDKDIGVSWQALWDMSGGKDYHIINFIRMAHYLGCEVIVRQTGTKDTEDPEMTPEKFAEIISRLKEIEKKNC